MHRGRLRREVDGERKDGVGVDRHGAASVRAACDRPELSSRPAQPSEQRAREHAQCTDVLVGMLQLERPCHENVVALGSLAHPVLGRGKASMQHARRAVACFIVFAAALAGLASYPNFKGEEPKRPSRHRTGPKASAPAVGFVEAIRESIVAGASAFPRAVVRQAWGNQIQGIDVSHYQGRIDWKRVARSGHNFVIAKATEGRTYIDRRYLRNKSEAEANHLAFGAYHFARPDKGPLDAVREANHFLDVARLEPGNVIPVLDLESSGGLSHRQLTRWILQWLRRVRDRLGVRPMVYTSSLGWAERTGDTTAVVEAGFDTLWVAHWNVRRPSLPAQQWGGYGWSIWQQTGCGGVPGVRG